MVYIYLLTKDGSYQSTVSNVKAQVTASKELCKQCKNVEVVTHKITYHGKYNNELVSYWLGSYYNVFIYRSSEEKRDKYIYGFYWPRKNKDIVKQIDTYYSLLDTLTPLAFVFTTRGDVGNKIYFSYESLVKAGSNWFKLKGTELDGDNIKGKSLILTLQDELKRVVKGVTFHGSYGRSSNIKRMPGNSETDLIGSKKQFSRFSLISSTKKNGNLYTDKLFQIPKENVKIPDKGSNVEFECDGLLVYQADNNPLLIECINGCNKRQFIRKDSNGFLWDKGSLDYDDYEKLVKELERVKTESEDKITFLLDKNVNYDNIVELTTYESQTGDPMYNYTMYKHTPKEKYANAKARVLYNNDLLKVLEDEQSKVQDKAYDFIETYSHSKNPNHLLIKFRVDQSNEIFYYRHNIERNEWKFKNISSEDFKINTTIVIYDFYYNFKKSIKIQLNHTTARSYKVVLVDNGTSTVPSESSPANSLEISVSEQNECVDKKYKCHIHDLSKCSSEKDLPYVAGLRLYNNSTELELYNDKKDRTYLRYLPVNTKEKNIYVYSDASDNTILLVCYSGKGYKVKSKKESEKLILDSEFRSCVCAPENKHRIIAKLEEIKKQFTEDTSKEKPSGPNGDPGGASSNSGNLPGEGRAKDTIIPGDNGKPGTGDIENVKVQHPEETYVDRATDDSLTQTSSSFDIWGFIVEHWVEFAGAGGGLAGIIIIIISIVGYKKCLKRKPLPSIEPLL